MLGEFRAERGHVELAGFEVLDRAAARRLTVEGVLDVVVVQIFGESEDRVRVGLVEPVSEIRFRAVSLSRFSAVRFGIGRRRREDGGLLLDAR